MPLAAADVRNSSRRALRDKLEDRVLARNQVGAAPPTTIWLAAPTIRTSCDRLLLGLGPDAAAPRK